MELNKELIDCMSKLRRALRDELALDIRLSQADAMQALYNGSLQSQNDDTRQAGQRLAVLAEIQVALAPVTASVIEELPVGLDAQPSSSYRVYRGQRIYN